MKIVNIKDRNYVKYLALVLFILFFIRVLLYPFFNKFTELNTELEINEAKFKKALQLISEKEHIQNQYKNLSGYISASDLIIDDKEELKVSFYKFINGVANSCAVTLRSVSPKASSLSRDAKSALYFEVDATSGIDNFLRFIAILEDPYSLISIDSLALNPYRGGELMFKLQLKRVIL